MDPCEQLGVGGLELEQVAVRALFPPEPVILQGSLAHAQGDRQRETPFDLLDDLSEPRRADLAGFPRLQDHRPVIIGVRDFRAIENLLLLHQVAGDLFVSRAQPAV